MGRRRQTFFIRLEFSSACEDGNEARRATLDHEENQPKQTQTSQLAGGGREGVLDSAFDFEPLNQPTPESH